MDSYSLVMGLADVQALLQVLWKHCFYSRKLHYIFVDFEIPFLALFINLSNRGEISSHQWKNYSENYNEKSRIMLTVKTLMSYKEWLFKIYDDSNFILLKRMLNGTLTKLALNLYGIIIWHIYTWNWKFSHCFKNQVLHFNIERNSNVLR